MLLLLKLILTPTLITAVSLAGRKWGPGVSGWLMGFPLTSGPISILLTIEYGKTFAVHSAVGSLGGMASTCIFYLVYSLSAPYMTWPASAAIAIASCLLSIAAWNLVSLSLLPTYLLAMTVCVLVLVFMPKRAQVSLTAHTPKWDLPGRMIAAAAFVVLLTTLAQHLGPQLSGLISPFPVFSVIIASFTHHQQGALAAGQLLRGAVWGSFAFISFFLATAWMLPSLPAWLAYGTATLAAIVVNSFTLRFTN
jgi:disulfide bond formation protein DsbB